ncbi:MAG: hypothetical protein ACOYWZ_06765 [Bacillota bacterium]
MAGTKRDYEIVSKIFMDFIGSLSNAEYDNLLNGSATIKYVEKGLPLAIKSVYDEIMTELLKLKTPEQYTNYIRANKELDTKSNLFDFCKYFSIETKAKDTLDMLISRIINHIEKNHDSLLYVLEKKSDIQYSIDTIASKLEDFMDIQQAVDFLKSSDVLSSKSNLLKLAKKLNVFIEKDTSHENILNSIIDSVVGAKIRSFAIRRKI